MRVALTAQGLRFILLIGIVGFAAYNNQNNLLYLMTSAGLAGVLIGVVAGLASLRGLAFAGSELPDAYAEVPFREKLLLANSARVFNAFGLAIEPAEPAANESVSIPFLETGSRGSCRVERLYRCRGRYQGEPVRVATRFPFGFFRVSRKLAAPRDILVFPRIRPIDSALLNASHGGLVPRAQRRGQGDEFFRLREYVPGDHIHHIHWKTSAKLDDMMIRELGEDEEERLCLGFVPVFTPFTNDDDTSEFEHLVSAAASLATHLAKSGLRFRFLAGDLELPPSRSREHTRQILTYLAEVEPTRELDSRFTTNVNRAVARGESVVVVAMDWAHGVGTVLKPYQILRHA